jgi:hypothetical protein
MDVLDGLATVRACRRIIVQNRNCSAQYVEQPRLPRRLRGRRPRAGLPAFTDFDPRARRSIVKAVRKNPPLFGGAALMRSARRGVVAFRLRHSSESRRIEFAQG